MENSTFLCIDLKSFYASVECVERGLDPFRANLVVADESRGRGAICLAISPALKALGIKNRCRIFEIPRYVSYITALPRMKLYMEYSANIYSVYLRFVSCEDIYVYSIDECFFDVTSYLNMYGKTPREMAQMIIDEVYRETGIRAAAGIGTNMFLAKVALDITAKHSADFIGELDEEKFRKTLWHHKPITDIWNIGPGIERRLSHHGIYDLYGVAHADEKILYREFGVNAEFLIDHSKGIEPCTIAEIHAYRPSTTSLSNGQILFSDYEYSDALTVLKEMVDNLSLELVDKNLVTDSISLRIGYSDKCEKSTGGTMKLPMHTNSSKRLREEFERYFLRTTKRDALIRKINISFNRLVPDDFVNFDLFSDYIEDERENIKAKVIIDIKKKFGKNAIIKGMSLKEEATAMCRNKLIGGHNGE